MKRLLLCFILFASSCALLRAQAYDVDFNVQEDNTIEITYSLSHMSNVTITASVDGGMPRQILNISGDYGSNVDKGRKRAVWDVLRDYPAGLKTNDLRIIVNAISVSTPEEARIAQKKERSSRWWKNDGSVNVMAVGAYNFYAAKMMYGARLDFGKDSGLYVKFVSTFNKPLEGCGEYVEEKFGGKEYVDYFNGYSITGGVNFGKRNNGIGYQLGLGVGYGKRNFYDSHEWVINSSRSGGALDLEAHFNLSITRLVFDLGITLPLRDNSDSDFFSSWDFEEKSDALFGRTTPELTFGIGLRF